MSQFWTDGWAVVEATRRLEIAREQNHRYLEIGGEPCYLFKRRKKGAHVAAIPGSGGIPLNLVPEPDPEIEGAVRFVIWSEGNSTNTYPKLDTFRVFVNGVEWQRAFDKTKLQRGETNFAIDEWKDRVDAQNRDIPTTVYLVLSSPPYREEDVVQVDYSTIAERISQTSMQPITVDDPLTARSLYGYEQYLNPNVMVRGRIIPNTFLLGFPSVPRNLELIQLGLQLTSSMKHWTQAPPYSPQIDEHDVIVRSSNMLRYEVIDMEYITYAGETILQQFNIVELTPDAPEYNLEVRFF